jgi:hypothetical protein
VATVDHSLPWSQATGIPCPTFVTLASGQPEVLYTYDSRNNFPLTEGKPIAWQYSGSDYQYVYFEMPLSFMERNSAKMVIQTALSGMLSAGAAAVSVIEPDTLDQSGDPPVSTTIYLGDFAEGHTASDIDQASLLVNGDLAPQSVSVQPSHPNFTGEVLEVIISTTDFLDTYGSIIDTIDKVYTVSWRYSGEPQTENVFGLITVIGQLYVPGDANGDWVVNVADAVSLINYVFKGGPPPVPLEAGDANCDGSPDIGDAVYIISYVFKGGPAPGCY